MQAIRARKLPSACDANWTGPYLVSVIPEKGIVPNKAEVWAHKAITSPFRSLIKAKRLRILPDRSLIAMHAEKLSRNPVLAAQNGSDAIITIAAAHIAETESLPAKDEDDMKAALVTDSLQPVIQAIRNAKNI